ncbi:MAG: hypothetical protein QGG73_06845 [Candidatus Hydrogenedentes bacterium]|jgi:hypothetical protein|nr:hypothetical protein [Candidatus Hydrogenedentota bacterium]
MAQILLLASLLLVSVGCVSIPIIAGTHPPVDRLEASLTIGKSGYGQVLEVLGTPDGQGRALLPMLDSSRSLWNYQFQTGTPDDLKFSLLLVLFDDGGIYDGYLWFSSVPEDIR